MYDEIQLITAAAALWPRRLYDDEQERPVRSLLLAAKVDWEAQGDGHFWNTDMSGRNNHPAYRMAAGWVELATRGIPRQNCPTSGHWADAVFRAAISMGANGIRGVELDKITEICAMHSYAA